MYLFTVFCIRSSKTPSSAGSQRSAPSVQIYLSFHHHSNFLVVILIFLTFTKPVASFLSHPTVKNSHSCCLFEKLLVIPSSAARPLVHLLPCDTRRIVITAWQTAPVLFSSIMQNLLTAYYAISDWYQKLFPRHFTISYLKELHLKHYPQEKLLNEYPNDQQSSDVMPETDYLPSPEQVYFGNLP